MTAYEFNKLVQEQINILINILKRDLHQSIDVDQRNSDELKVELNYVDLIANNFTEFEVQQFQTVKAYFDWIDTTIKKVDQELKTDKVYYHLGQNSFIPFIYLFIELEKIFYGNETQFKISMANIQVIFGNTSY